MPTLVEQIYEIVRIMDLEEALTDPATELFFPVDTSSFVLEPKRISKTLLSMIIERMIGMTKVEKNLRSLAKDSPITQYFPGSEFPDTNYRLHIKCTDSDGNVFEPVIINEAEDSFTFNLDLDCDWEYDVVWAPIGSGS